MRADRLLTELMLLQARGKMTALELAREVQVTVRTVYRDVEALCFSGVPVYTERGPGGGISLVESYRTTLTGLKRNEVRALFMLSIPALPAELGLGDEARTALLKLSAALPSTLRDEEQRTRQRFYIDPSGWQVSTGSGLKLAAIQKAVWEDRVLQVRYLSILGERVDPLDVEVEPYGLVAWQAEWHLICRREGGNWVVRLDRILESELLTKYFKRDPNFDLAMFWKEWLMEETGQPRQFLVRAIAIREVLPYLADYLVEAVPIRVLDSKPSDRNRVVLSFKNLEQARSRLLGLGGAVRVLEPRALRLSITDFANQIVALYMGGEDD